MPHRARRSLLWAAACASTLAGALRVDDSEDGEIEETKLAQLGKKPIIDVGTDDDIEKDCRSKVEQQIQRKQPSGRFRASKDQVRALRAFSKAYIGEWENSGEELTGMHQIIAERKKAIEDGLHADVMEDQYCKATHEELKTKLQSQRASLDKQLEVYEKAAVRRAAMDEDRKPRSEGVFKMLEDHKREVQTVQLEIQKTLDAALRGISGKEPLSPPRGFEEPTGLGGYYDRPDAAHNPLENNSLLAEGREGGSRRNGMASPEDTEDMETPFTNASTAPDEEEAKAAVVKALNETDGTPVNTTNNTTVPEANTTQVTTATTTTIQPAANATDNTTVSRYAVPESHGTAAATTKVTTTKDPSWYENWYQPSPRILHEPTGNVAWPDAEEGDDFTRSNPKEYQSAVQNLRQGKAAIEETIGAYATLYERCLKPHKRNTPQYAARKKGRQDEADNLGKALDTLAAYMPRKQVPPSPEPAAPNQTEEEAPPPQIVTTTAAPAVNETVVNGSSQAVNESKPAEWTRPAPTEDATSTVEPEQPIPVFEWPPAVNESAPVAAVPAKETANQTASNESRTQTQTAVNETHPSANESNVTK